MPISEALVDVERGHAGARTLIPLVAAAAVDQGLAGTAVSWSGDNNGET